MRREDRNFPPGMQNQQIVIARQNEVGMPRKRQFEKLVIFWVTAFRDTSCYFDELDRKAEVDESLKPHTGGKVPVEFRP